MLPIMLLGSIGRSAHGFVRIDDNALVDTMATISNRVEAFG
jgi:hypothetical protein